jgi:hypothetical protein
MKIRVNDILSVLVNMIMETYNAFPSRRLKANTSCMGRRKKEIPAKNMRG